MTKSEILQAFYERVWLKGDLSAVDEFFTTEGAASGFMANDVVGATDIKTLVEAFRGFLEDGGFSLTHTLEQGDWLATVITLHATTQSGQDVQLQGQVMARFEGNKIAEAFNQFDYFAFFEQVGLLPEDAMAMFLTGTIAA